MFSPSAKQGGGVLEVCSLRDIPCSVRSRNGGSRSATRRRFLAPPHAAAGGGAAPPAPQALAAAGGRAAGGKSSTCNTISQKAQNSMDLEGRHLDFCLIFARLEKIWS